MNTRQFVLAAIFTSSVALPGQPPPAAAPKPCRERSRHLYKQTAARPLYLYSLAPTGFDSPRPAIVFFFGGGWVSGSIDQFDDQAAHFTERGLVSILVDYRVK